jgi:hypothetical protein
VSHLDLQYQDISSIYQVYKYIQILQPAKAPFLLWVGTGENFLDPGAGYATLVELSKGQDWTVRVPGGGTQDGTLNGSTIRI